MKTKYDNIDTMIQNYVLGRLNDAQAAEFEEYFLSNPDLIEQIETAQLMHAGLLQAEQLTLQKSADSNTTAINSPKKSKQLSAKPWYEKLRNLIFIPVPAFAVMAMAAVMLPMALQNSNNLKQNSNISLINFSTQTTRSTNQGVTIDLSENNQNMAMLVKFKSVDFPNYKLKLIPIGESNPVWESELFQLSSLRDKLISLPSNSYGKVSVEVVGIDDNLNESEVEFCHYSEICN